MKRMHAYLERGVLAPNSTGRAASARVVNSVATAIRPDRAAEANAAGGVWKLARLGTRLARILACDGVLQRRTFGAVMLRLVEGERLVFSGLAL